MTPGPHDRPDGTTDLVLDEADKPKQFVDGQNTTGYDSLQDLVAQSASLVAYKDVKLLYFIHIGQTLKRDKVDRLLRRQLLYPTSSGLEMTMKGKMALSGLLDEKEKQRARGKNQKPISGISARTARGLEGDDRQGEDTGTLPGS